MHPLRWTILLIAGAALAQNPPTPGEILRKVRESYTSVRRFDIAGTFEMIEADASRQLVALPFRMAAERPDKLRIEGEMGAMTHGASQGGTLISDGKTTWSYDAKQRAYTRKPGPLEIDVDMDDHELRQMGIDPKSSAAFKMSESLLFMFRKIADMADTARLLRTEKCAGMPEAGCYVIEGQEGPAKPTNTIWIDTAGFRVRRIEAAQVQAVRGKSVNVVIRLSFSTVSLNEPLPGDTFRFVPPPDAKQVDELQ
jgi:outer membrane lipoprotein-sorting protein